MKQMEDRDYPLGTTVVLPPHESMSNVPNEKEWVVIANNKNSSLHFFTATRFYQENARYTQEELVAMGMETRQEKHIYRLANYRFLVSGMMYSQNSIRKGQLDLLTEV